MTDLIAFLNARLDEDERYLTSNQHHLWTQRPLREVEAERKLLADRWGGPDHQDMWEHHVRLLAAVYSDHPDYRQEWKP